MKKLENEYKDLLSKDIPDLWDRIEAGLEEKKVEVLENVETKEPDGETVDKDVVEEAVNKGNVNKEVSEKTEGKVKEFSTRKRKSNRGRIIHFGGLVAAACICILVARPLFMNRDNVSFAPADAGVACEQAQEQYAAEDAEQYYSGDFSPQEEMCESEQIDVNGSSISTAITPIDPNGNTVQRFEQKQEENKLIETENESEETLEYHLGLEIVEVTPQIKAKVIKSEKNYKEVQLGDVITLIGTEEIYDFILGECIDVYVTPITLEDKVVVYKILAEKNF